MIRKFRKLRAKKGRREKDLPSALCILLSGFFVLALTGCLVPSQEAVKKPSSPLKQAQISEVGEKPPDSILVKPFIPAESDSGETGASITESPQPGSPETIRVQIQSQPEAPAPVPEQPMPAGPPSAQVQPEPKPEVKGWEDEKVKTLALGLAKGFPAGSKIKICYAVKRDEWWVTLYEDAGAVFELKQYTWNRDQDKLEPFLVLKTVPKEKLEEHLNSPEPDKACEVIETAQKQI